MTDFVAQTPADRGDNNDRSVALDSSSEVSVAFPSEGNAGHQTTGVEGNTTPVAVDKQHIPGHAQWFLREASRLMAARGKQYDKTEGERSMSKAVSAFNTITGQHISEAEGWLLLQILKDVRQWQRPEYHADSAEDCVAYAALKAEALAGSK